jgi:hypothetical protein
MITLHRDGAFGVKLDMTCAQYAWGGCLLRRVTEGGRWIHDTTTTHHQLRAPPWWWWPARQQGETGRNC